MFGHCEESNARDYIFILSKQTLLLKSGKGVVLGEKLPLGFLKLYYF
jgi:hypothetical protein